MSPQDLAEVRKAPLFATLQESQSGCLEPGEIIELPQGAVLAPEGEATGYFYVLLEGEIRITRTYDKQTILMAVSKPGSHLGEIMLLLGVPWLSTARISKAARLFQLDEDGFWNMLATCHTVARELFRTATNRVRNFEGYSQQREKLASLGTMAAGLAHELNNPAAAARRAASHLRETTEKVQRLICELSGLLDEGHWDTLMEASKQATDRIEHNPPVLDDLERSDRSEVLAQWLEKHNVGSPWDLAPIFVSAGVPTEQLGQLAAKLPPAAHADALAWLAARLDLKMLLSQIEQSTERIANLVKAVKSYSYMDQSPMQDVDIHEGIESTLTMLGHKLKNVTVKRSFDRSLPLIPAYGSELNQVWTNLIDNAIDAVDGKGKIYVSTAREDDTVVVEIVDNGPGIPVETQARMFEPFFTTKSVGKGTGLGLIISNRIVGDRHGGEIEFDSRPGETRFRVRLPITREKPEAA